MDSALCVLCDRPSDQPGRFCTRCTGRSSLLARMSPNIEVGPAQLQALRVLQWPISLLLLGAAALAGMRTAALTLDLSAALRARRSPGTPPDLVTLHRLAAVEQRLVVVGLALVATVGMLWLLWWAVAYANLRPLGISPRHHGVWAVLSWAVPIADLVVPQRVADELWRGSDPWAPLGWRQARYGRRAGVVRLWWLSWLGALLLVAGAQAALAVLVRHPTLGTFHARATGAVVADGCLIASSLLTALAGLGAIVLVTGVTARQEERARLMAEAGLI